MCVGPSKSARALERVLVVRMAPEERTRRGQGSYEAEEESLCSALLLSAALVAPLSKRTHPRRSQALGFIRKRAASKSRQMLLPQQKG